MFKARSTFVLLFLALGSHALADQAISNSDTLQTQSAGTNLHPVVILGATNGGGSIYTSTYSNGTSQNIKGGEGIQIGVGGLWQFEKSPVAMIMTANYHVDDTQSSTYDFVSAYPTNGQAEFRRYPIEMLAYYTRIERIRIGGGLRYVVSPQVIVTYKTRSINEYTDRIRFNNTIGLVAEIGYQLKPIAGSFADRFPTWISLRAVFEKYHLKSITSGDSTTAWVGESTINGSHFGVNILVEF